MPRDDRLYLVDIGEASAALRRFLHGKSFDDLVADEILSAAVLQKFIVIGEAGGRLSADLKARYPRVPWHRIVALRNVAVHEYFAIRWHVVWNAATSDVPDLAAIIEQILQDEFPSGSGPIK